MPAVVTKREMTRSGARKIRPTDLDALSAMTGLTAEEVDAALGNLQQRLVKSQRSLVQLEPLGGGVTMTVRASSLRPAARSYSSLHGVEVPGYRVRPMPDLDLHAQVDRAVKGALSALTSTFGEQEDARTWMQTGNAAFAGKTPASVLGDGQVNAITTVLGAARRGVAL